MNFEKEKNIDNIIIITAVCMLFCPIVIFCLGWLKWVLSIPISLFLIWVSIRVYWDLKDHNIVSLYDNRYFWLISVFIIIIWILFSGIGAFSYQTWDFVVRNPIYNDLIHSKWPLYVNITNLSDSVKSIFPGSNKCELVYYFSWWLPPALLCKVFKLNMDLCNTVLFLYAYLETIIIFYLLIKYLGRVSYLALSSLILFGGMDWVIDLFVNLSIPKAKHVEWWAGYFEFSSNTTSVYWAFNSSLPIWLIVLVLLLLRTNKLKGAVGAISAAYNPFATIPMIFIVILFCIKNNENNRFKNMISIPNIVTSLCMLCVFGLFYSQTSINHKISEDGFIFDIYSEKRLFTIYILFVFIEFIIYYIVMRSNIYKQKYYYLPMILLLLIPLVKVGRYNDFSLKAPMPVLFLLMIVCLERYYIEKSKITKYALLLSLFLGYMTSVAEIQRNISFTLLNDEDDYINNYITSFETLNIDDKEYEEFLVLQYFAPDENNMWQKVLEK